MVKFLLSQILALSELIKRLEKAVAGPVKTFASGSKKARAIGVITGAAGSEIERVVADGIDTFITGEAPHWAAIAAEELGINLLLAGHYATETFGVKALAAISRKNSGLIGNSSVCQRDFEITVLPKTCSLPRLHFLLPTRVCFCDP